MITNKHTHTSTLSDITTLYRYIHIYICSMYTPLHRYMIRATSLFIFNSVLYKNIISYFFPPPRVNILYNIFVARIYRFFCTVLAAPCPPRSVLATHAHVLRPDMDVSVHAHPRDTTDSRVPRA